ncbi:MAG: hypothetical protein JXR76_17125 [Deltaproteobacteria bacterium]|nr:hypothetical protein [Deltaproteobacteria bacterium]
MKKNVPILIVAAAVLLAANTALAGTDFYYAEVTFDVIYNPTGESLVPDMVTKRATTKNSRSACDALDPFTADCITYEVSPLYSGLSAPEQYGNYLVAREVVGALMKSGSEQFAVYSPEARFNEGSYKPWDNRTTWKDDSHEPAGTYIFNTGYEKDDTDYVHISRTVYYGTFTKQYVKGEKIPLLRMTYKYLSNGSTFGREFHYTCYTGYQ